MNVLTKTAEPAPESLVQPPIGQILQQRGLVGDNDLAKALHFQATHRK